MKLERMTVTGADDMTNVRGMIELSKEYRFLEWGILFPLSGGSRFPTSEWLAHLLEEKAKTPMNLSAHLCGGDLDDALENKSKINLDEFKRIQLNFHGLNYYQLVMKSVTDTEMTLFTVEKFLESVSNKKVIFQFDGVNDGWIYNYLNNGDFPNIQYLFDTSSGAGILPGTFPMPYKDVTCGFAGGIGPDNINNVVDTLKQNLSPTKPFWIDMETRVRTDGDLDLNKVGQCAEIVAREVFGRHSI
tara:strand:- start:388 stop:1122 length:735 start_codon:yes stop_codon:yes gene_type:complete